MASDATDPAAGAARAIAEHFEGDAALYAEFRAGCLLQFPLDIALGDAACANGDAAALRRLGHSLATVLQTLGHPAASTLARELEQRAALGGSVPARHWQQLRGMLQALSERKI